MHFNDLRGKRALITGASSGIGKEFAQQLAQYGVHLILTARSQERLTAVAQEIKEKYTVEVEIIVDDLSSNGAPKRIYNMVQRKGLNVDLLINNAGFGYVGRFEDEDYDHARALDTVNVVSLVSLTRLFLPHMLLKDPKEKVNEKKNKRKKETGEEKKNEKEKEKQAIKGIINVASLMGLQAFPYAANYAASKAFIYNFSQALWYEYKDRGVRIVCLCPGLTKTNFGKEIGKESVFERGLDPKMVVEEAILALLENEPVIIPEEQKNLMLQYGSRFLPRKTVLERTARLFAPRSAEEDAQSDSDTV